MAQIFMVGAGPLRSFNPEDAGRGGAISEGNPILAHNESQKPG